MSTGIYLRAPKLSDQAEFLAAARKSRALHGAWVKPPRTADQFVQYLERMATPSNCALLVCRADTHSIVGVITISNIVLGLFHSGYLGFYVFAGHERQGWMRMGLKAAVRHAFKSLKLHRLEANIQPENAASIALAQTCGFSMEGYSPCYLKIAGRWRDHQRWAILASK